MKNEINSETDIFAQYEEEFMNRLEIFKIIFVVWNKW
jgi:hypothetical protein